MRRRVIKRQCVRGRGGEYNKGRIESRAVVAGAYMDSDDGKGRREGVGEELEGEGEEN